ncbi:hypothetical protein GCM10012320_08360 [Sinomonas cellulolyticus]|nr:hypothetical protein GCM10012320_08360 [Sinomonas sp. KCTC 49339]
MGDTPPRKNPIEWLWNASLLIIGSVILLTLAWQWVQPILPIIVGVAIIGIIIWLVVSIRRVRRDHW